MRFCHAGLVAIRRRTSETSERLLAQNAEEYGASPHSSAIGAISQ
jgi:hypothetical protein